MYRASRFWMVICLFVLLASLTAGITGLAEEPVVGFVEDFE